MWQATPESSLDPRGESGPIPFTTSSLLGLAYVRLHLDTGPHRDLHSRDRMCIASALNRLPRVSRGTRLTPALLYACHCLSIPVRLGVDYVAKTQAFHWSVRHCLSSLECAVLLAKWLFELSETKESHKTTGRSASWTLPIVLIHFFRACG